MSYGHTITLNLPFQGAIARVKDAFGLGSNGWSKHGMGSDSAVQPTI
jgi:hypothetical protein